MAKDGTRHVMRSFGRSKSVEHWVAEPAVDMTVPIGGE